MKKRIISLLLVAVMVLTMLPSSFAEEAVEPTEIAADYSNVVAWLDTDDDGVIDEGEDAFEILADAFAAVADSTEADSAVVKLLKDVELEEDFRIHADGFTFDLNGKTVSGCNYVHIDGNAVTVKDGVFDRTCLAVCSEDVRVIDCIINGNGEIGIGLGITCGGELTVENCTITGNYFGLYLSSCTPELGETLNVTVKNCEIDGVIVFGGNLTVEGGEFYGSLESYGSLTVTGGSFDSDPSAYVAEGYAVTQDPDTGRWIVSGTGSAPDYSDVVAWIDRDDDGEIGSGEETYASLQEAVDAIAAMAVADNTILKLNEDVELGETSLTVSSGVFTFDLNGRTVNRAVSGGSAVVVSGGTVTVTDSSSEKSGTISGVNNAIVMHGGKLHILDGNFSGRTAIYLSGGSTTVSGGKITGGTDGTGIYVYYLFGGDVTIEGGEITGDRNGVRGDGDAITITGGSFYGYYAGLQMNRGNARITGGEIKGKYSGVEVAGGSISLEDGEISGDDAVYVRKGSAGISGGTVTGSMHGVYIDGGAAVITGGTVIGDIGVQIHQGDVIIQNGDISGRNGVFAFGGKATVSGGYITGEEFGLGVNGGEAVISGGSFVGGQDTDTNNYEAVYVWDGSAEITGGSFNSDPSAYVAEGYTVVENEYNGMWRVEESAAVAWLDADLDGEFDAGESKFDSLESAFAAVRTAKEADQAVIRLCADVDAGEVPFYITSGEFALDLNGHNLRSTYTALVLVGGNVIIDDSQPEKLCTISGDKTIAVGGGLLTVSNGMISGDICAISVTGGDVIIKDGNIVDGVYIDYGSLNIEGGSVSGVQVLGGTVTVSGGDVYGGGCGIAAESGTVYISGGLVEGDRCGVEVSGKSEIHVLEGGTVSSSNYGMIVHDGTVTVNGGKVSGSERGLVAKGGTVTVEAGGVSGYYDCGLYVDGGDVTVTGGAFSAKYFSVQHQSGSLTITGGRFSSDPSAYVAEEYEVTADAESGYFVVAKQASDFIVEDGVLIRYLGEGGEVVIPEEVTAIGVQVFYGCKELKKVVIPEGVKSIGTEAFAFCENLTAIQFPETLEKIGDWAFVDCFALENLVLPESDVFVDVGAFCGCTGLKELVLPEYMHEIKESVFAGCAGLVKLILPETVTIIGEDAFAHCTSLKEVVLPHNLTKLGIWAFARCNALEELVFESETVPEMSDGNPFYELSMLKTVYVPAEAYEEYEAALTDVLAAGVELVAIGEESNGLRIVSQPVDYVGMVGEVAEFDVIAKGEGLTYQWYYFDRNVSQWKKSSSTEGYLDVEFKAYRNGQQYKCVITDAEGNTVETDAVSILAEEIELMIDEQPVSHVGAVNDQVVFSCGAVGNGLLYQWYYSTDGGENWMMSGSPGYNTDTLLPILRAYRNGQQYCCRITDVFGNVVETDVVDMTVRSSEVVIVKQPETVEYGLLGQLHYFTVDAEGDNLTYQWEVSKDGGETWEKSYNDGCDTARLSVRLYAYRSGYQYRCVVSSGLKNTVVTDAAVLKLQPASVKIVTEPVSRGFMVQKNVHFNVEAEGMDLTYQWYRSNDGGNTWVKTYLDGYDTDTLYFKATAARCALYRCYVTDGSGTEAYSKAAKLTLIDKELVLLRQPEDVYCQNGDTAVFAVEAEGAGLKYQWYASADGGETWAVTWLGGSDTDTLSFKVNETRAAKLYKCVITDAGNNTVETEPVSVTIMDGELPESSSTVKEVSPIMLNGELRWQFDVLLENTGFTNLTLDQVLVTKYQGGKGGTMVASDTFGKERLPELHLADENGPLKLAPGETHVWGDGHPVVEDFDCIEYVFMFTYDNGKQAVKTYTYTLLDGWTEAAVDCFGRPGTIFHNDNGSMFYTDVPDAITIDGTNPFAKVEDIAAVYHNGEKHETFDASELGKGVRAEKYGSTLVLIDSFMTVVVQTSVRYGTATLEDGTVIKNTGYEPGDVVAIQLCDGSCVGDSAIQYDGHCGSYVHCNWFTVVEPQTIVVDQVVSMVSRPANSYIVTDSGLKYYYSGNLNKDLVVNDSAADDNGIMSWSAKGRAMHIYCDEYGYIQYWCAVPAPAPVMQVGYFVENTNTAKLKDNVVNQPLESSYDYTVDVVGMDAVCTNIQTSSNTYHLMVERSYDTQGVWCGGILALYGANGDIAMTAAVAGQETYLDRTTGELVGESFVDGMNYHVSNNTQFLIRTWDFASGWYSYQAVTGYKGVPEYLGKVALGGTAYNTIQYLDVDGDGVIDYLFVDAFYVREAEVNVQIVELEMKASVAELGRFFPYLDVYTAYIDGMLCYVAYYDMNGIPLESGKLYRTVAQAVGATYMGDPIYVAMEAC